MRTQRIIVKVLLLLSTLVILCLLADSCGSGSSATMRSATAASPGSAPSPLGPRTAAAERSFKGDEDDDDNPGESNGYSAHDPDADQDNDQKDKERGYRDPDDSSVLAYGHAASSSEGQALQRVVRRYYTAASTGDGATACAMLLGSVERAIPEDYGSGAGPAYLRDSKTCAAIMSRLFAHLHRQLSAPLSITAMRVGGSQALVVLGSTTLPASFLSLERGGDSWKVTSLLATGLP